MPARIPKVNLSTGQDRVLIAGCLAATRVRRTIMISHLRSLDQLPRRGICPLDPCSLPFKLAAVHLASNGRRKVKPARYPVIDLEATCCEWRRIARDQGAVMVEAEGFQLIDEFQSFIRPIRHPSLTTFCTELTSIQQEQIDSPPLFQHVMLPYGGVV